MTSPNISARARRPVSLLWAIAAALPIATSACQKVPLLAPTGSSITLSTPTAVLPLNGTTTITAQVLEAAGTPPHSGTLVNFTTTMGTIQPAEER